MTFSRLLLRNLFYHWRGNVAVFLGVAIGTAVLIGALLVGDSLRGSLRDLTLQRLGWVDQALVAGRFFREELADANKLQVERISPALLLQGTINAVGETPARRAGRVTVLGVDDRFWPKGELPRNRAFWQPGDNEVLKQLNVVFLNATLARELGVKEGDEVTLHVQKASAVPRESLLGRREASDVINKVELTVAGVLPDDSPGGRFSLNPSPETPRNAFVPLHLLQTKLGLKGRVNALLVGGSSKSLQENLGKQLDLEDWNLILREHPRQGYLSLESRQMLLEPAVEEAAFAAAQDCGLRTAPTLVYLANTISDGKREIPYSVVAALDPTLSAPLGPFLPAARDRLQDDEIVLADWKESPLKGLEPGDPITLKYFLPDAQGGLRETSETFRLAGWVPLEGVSADPDLVPEFPGITDKLTIRDWNPPFPYDNRRIKPNDANERYWKEYRTTPKAYITLAKGQELWHSRFGNLTSIRLAPAGEADLKQKAEQFREGLRNHLKPEQGGFVFDAVKERGLEASVGGTNFSEYFLYFSFFLIVAALLLVGLLFRLNLDRRAAEVGLLLAAGYRRGTVGWLLLAEGTLLAAAGALVGCVGAVLYAWLLLELLRAWWPGALDRSFLRLHVTALSFVIGYVAALIVSVLTVGWAVWAMSRVSPRALLAGETTAESDPARELRPPRWSVWLGVGAAVGALILVVVGFLVRHHEVQVFTFFGSGALLLTAGLAGVWAWMRSTRHGQVSGQGTLALARLGARNAARHPVRSLLTAGLLAAAAFLLVAVESFRRHPEQDFLDRKSGSGGFALLGESDLPIYENLDSDDGRKELKEGLEKQLRSQVEPDKLKSMQADLAKVAFYPFRLRAGDDASCLNLYQPRRPRLLGVPRSLVKRGGFRFADSEARSAEERDNPWRLLEQPHDDGTIPVLGEENTVTYMLKSKLGGVMEVPDERGVPRKLRIVGLFKDSIFQSGLLMSEANFANLYPSQEGFNFFLIDTADGQPQEVKSLLETALADRGFEASFTAQKLASYLAVENTYLSTFQALGGLGLLLGALGLAVVLLRGVWERRGELALLRALGYRSTALGWLLLAENGFLLILGLGAGAGAALLAVAPHLTAGAGQVPWPRLLGMLTLVLIVGLAAGTAAVIATLRAPLVPALRRE